MAKNRVRTGFSGEKVDNFCVVPNGGGWEREAGLFWRDSLQKGQIKVTLQGFMLVFAAEIASRKHF
ncbi:hypothetical protein [Candidatus Pantoea soli]|uniref:Uncharacterized protein n=1 Tax=Candidatus Pantoea soli TaxID=3098669 RepID=A0A518XGS0_9GAMM|nr:hypothetical protein [Pantoea soli]QDY43395.1 hypothetical protein D8B20_16580 [Pantoea soli]